MHSRLDLVLILLTLGYLVSGLRASSLHALKREKKNSSSSSSALNTRNDLSTNLKRPVSVKIHRPAITGAISTHKNASMTNGTIIGASNVKKNVAALAVKTNKHELIHDLHSALGFKWERDVKKKRKHKKKKKNRALMALLLAYKLKFMALIPTVIGGLFLLVSTTALAGFFFALFAAVLGLKNHS